MKTQKTRPEIITETKSKMAIDIIVQLLYNKNAYSRGAFHRIEPQFFDEIHQKHLFKIIKHCQKSHREINIHNIVALQNECDIPTNMWWSHETLLNGFPDDLERLSTNQLKALSYDFTHFRLRDEYTELISVVQNRINTVASRESILKPMEKFMMRFRSKLSAGENKSIEQIVQNYEHDAFAEKRQQNEIFTGIPSIDEQIGGSSGGELILIAARPSMGKSMFAMGCYKNLTQSKKRCIFHSLETVSERNYEYLVSNIGEIKYSDITKRILKRDDPRYISARAEILANKNIILHDKSGINANDLKSECIDALENGGLDVLFVDHGAIMKHDMSDSSNEATQIGATSMALKEMAKELNICVVLLYQLNRSVETRDGYGKPKKSDLRGSGRLEEDADKIFMIWRPSVYVEYADQEKIGLDDFLNEQQWNDLAFICVEKNRHGKPFIDLEMTFRPLRARFENFKYISDSNGNFSNGIMDQMTNNQNPPQIMPTGNENDVPF